MNFLGDLEFAGTFHLAVFSLILSKMVKKDKFKERVRAILLPVEYQES